MEWKLQRCFLFLGVSDNRKTYRSLAEEFAVLELLLLLEFEGESVRLASRRWDRAAFCASISCDWGEHRGGGEGEWRFPFDEALFPFEDGFIFKLEVTDDLTFLEEEASSFSEAMVSLEWYRCR